MFFMSETIITVHGSASDWFDAERGTVSVEIAHDGPARAPVFDATTTVAAQVTAAFAELEGGAVTRWSSDRVRVSSRRPWNKDGVQLAPVYQAAVTASARFRDFDALAAFVERFATVTGVQVQGIAWDLTHERLLAVVGDIQARAVEDATLKATTYARAAGLTSVVPLAIADPGMLGDGSSGQPEFAAPATRGSAMLKASDSSGADLALTPDRIEVSARVDARFLAR